MEEFRDVKGYEGRYQVSNLGNVRSFVRSKEGHLIRASPMKNGYYRVTMHKKTKKIHQLVAEAFLNHIPCGMKYVVDHIDNDKSNNNVSNLQIITNRENVVKDSCRGRSDFVGVTWSSPHQKWRARIHTEGVRVHLGLFSSETDASDAYKEALTKINNI